MPFTFVDLFAGIGGFRLAFEAVGGTCVMTCEIDRYARQTYAANFNVEHPFPENIREVAASDVPDHDVLLAGFPCQSFSIAGLGRRTWGGIKNGIACEKQGNLFLELLRILEVKRPDYFLFENVPNLRRINDGQAYRTIMESLHHLGYQVECQIIDGIHWVPQRRRRLFFAGFRNATHFRWANFKIPRGPLPILRDILHPEDGTEQPDAPYTLENGKVSPKYTLGATRWENMVKRIERKPQLNYVPDLCSDEDQANTLCASYYRNIEGTGSLVSSTKWVPYIKSADDQSTVLTSRYTAVISNTLLGQNNKPPRFFTPRECSRLMGFDAFRGSDFKIPVSDAQAYKQFGNSVVVPCVTDIARAMISKDAASDGEYMSPNLPLF